MSVELGSIFSIVVALIGVYATFNKINGDLKKDRESQIKRAEDNREKQTERHMELKIGQDLMNSTLQEMNRQFKDMSGKIETIDRRVTVVEESVKSAHKRLDGE